MKNKNKRSKKLAAVFILIAAGSVFYGTTQADAKGLELDGIQITFGRHRGYDAPPPPPPPPPPPHVHHFHGRPEPWDHGSRGPRHEDFGPHGREHMPPPPHR